MKNMKIKIFGTLVFVLGAALVVVGVASASTADTIQPAGVITYNEELVVNDTGRFDSVYVGKQDVGGVTFFNGTIVNSTTNDGADNPVTFGDNVRIDGEIYRTEKGGDDPLKMSDTVIPTMDNTNDFGSSTNGWKDGYFDGTLNVGALGGTGVVTSTNITDGTITGSDVSSSAALSVASITTSGNVVGNGAVKALVHVESNSITKSWTYDNSSVSIVHIGVGSWSVNFSSSGFNLDNNYFSVVNETNLFGYTMSTGLIDGDSLMVANLNSVPALTDTDFYLVVY